jgi:hypothetical protein
MRAERGAFRNPLAGTHLMLQQASCRQVAAGAPASLWSARAPTFTNARQGARQVWQLPFDAIEPTSH